jgi:hypothetical protein
MLPIDVASNQTNIGIAIVNASSTDPVTVKFTLLDENSTTPLTATDPKLTNLAPLNQVAQFITASFPALAQTGFKGTLIAEVVGSGNIASVGLIYKTGCSFGCASSVPVADLSSEQSDPKLTREQKLLGNWTFNYTLLIPWTDQYYLDSVVPDPTNPGEYLVVGLSNEGTAAKAQYSDALQAYSLFEAETNINELYVFNFTGSDTVTGCYYIQSNSDGSISDCYPLTGSRTPLVGLALKTSNRAQKAAEMRTKAQTQNTDARILAVIEKMK